MHLLAAAALALAFALFLDWPRVKAEGPLFVLKDHLRQLSQKVTLRRIIYTIAILLFVCAAWQALGFDWALIAVGGDAMLYLEIIAAAYLVVVRGYFQQMATMAASAITQRIQKTIPSLRSRRRDRRSVRHDPSSGDESDGEAEPAILQAFAFS